MTPVWKMKIAAFLSAGPEPGAGYLPLSEARSRLFRLVDMLGCGWNEEVDGDLAPLFAAAQSSLFHSQVLERERSEASLKRSKESIELSPGNGLQEIAAPAPKEFREALQRAVTSVRNCVAEGLDGRALYLALWAELPFLVSELVPNAALFPASRLYPSIPVWAAMDVSAALANCQVPPGEGMAILSVELPWAQSLPTGGRLGPDLGGASLLAEDLLWAAVRPVVQRCGPEAVLFPALRGWGRLAEWLSAEGVQLRSWPAGERLASSTLHILVSSSVVEALMQEITASCLAAARLRAGETADLLEGLGIAPGPGWRRQATELAEIHFAVSKIGVPAESSPLLPSAVLRSVNALSTVPGLQSNAWAVQLAYGLAELRSRVASAKYSLRFSAWRGDRRPKDAWSGIEETIGPLHPDRQPGFWMNSAAALAARYRAPVLLPNERLAARSMLQRLVGLERGVSLCRFEELAIADWREQVKGAGLPPEFYHFRQRLSSYLAALKQEQPGTTLDDLRWFDELSARWFFRRSYEATQGAEEGPLRLQQSACISALNHLLSALARSPCGGPPEVFALARVAIGEPAWPWREDRMFSSLLHPEAMETLSRTCPWLSSIAAPAGIADLAAAALRGSDLLNRCEAQVMRVWKHAWLAFRSPEELVWCGPCGGRDGPAPLRRLLADATAALPLKAGMVVVGVEEPYGEAMQALRASEEVTRC